MRNGMNRKISVTANDESFKVVVSDGGRERDYTVTVDGAYHQKLASSGETKIELIRRSFEFLLEREPMESILSSFDLKVINRYFPEYESSIKR